MQGGAQTALASPRVADPYERIVRRPGNVKRAPAPIDVDTTIGDMDVQQVFVGPSSIELDYGDMQLFSAAVAGAGDPTVIWSVNGFIGSNSTVGTIDMMGNYTAPDLASAGSFPFTVTAFNPELGLTGYALVGLSCSSAGMLTDDAFTADSLPVPGSTLTGCN